MLVVDCSPMDVAELQDRLADYGPAFYDRDRDAASDAHDRVMAAVPCLSQVVSPGVAAALHRVHGMQQWFDAPSEVTATFTAARLTNPSTTIPSNAAREYDHVRGLWEQGAPTGERVEVHPPDYGTLWIDGRQRPARSTSLPALVQLVDATGTVRYTGYLEPQEDPDFSGIGPLPAPVNAELGGWTAEHFRTSTVPLLSLGAATAVGSLVANGISGSRRAAFEDRSVPRTDAELVQLKRQTNTASTVSIVSALGAVALTGVGVATVRW